MQRCPASRMRVSSIEIWLEKSSCWESCWAMQQFWLSIGHTGKHLARSWVTSKPLSLRTDFMPFGWPESVVIFWGWPQMVGNGLDCGITVSHCFRCLSPSDLFMLKACNASGGKDPCADDWLKIKIAWQLGWAILNMLMASHTCTRSWLQSHQGSLFEPG